MFLCTDLCSAISYLRSDYNKKGGNNSSACACACAWKQPVEIHLPLRRPKQHDKTSILTQPIKNIKNGGDKIEATAATARRKKMKNTSSDVLRLMDSLGLPISPEIYASLINECTFTCDASRALELHAHLNRSYLKLTLPFINRLLLMYVSCGHLNTARHLFDQMSMKKDFNSWAIIIIGYLGNAEYEETIRLFIKMLLHHDMIHISEFPTWVIVFILKACCYTMNMDLRKQVHGLLLKVGRTASNLHMSGSLINLYGKLRCVECANLVFDQLLHRNTVIWTAKIVNECREGRFNEVMKEFKEMGRAGIRRNRYTFCSVLRACGRMDDGEKYGRQVHVQLIKLGLESDVLLGCRLIDMYGKCGMVQDAKRVFHFQDITFTDKRNTAYWNAMLLCYAQNGLYVDALTFAYQMEAAGIEVHTLLLDEIRIACGTTQQLRER